MDEEGKFHNDNFYKAMSILDHQLNENESKQAKKWKNNSKGKL